MTAATVPVEADVERVNRLQEEFRILHRLGLHLFPVGADKLPIGKWALGAVNYVETRATIAQGDKWATDPRVRGWANLCGARDVKVFTFDVEAAGMDYPQVTGVLDALPASCQRPSPNGGRHAVVMVSDGDPVATEALAFGSGRLLVEVRGVGRDGNNGAYAVITGPGRGPLPRDFSPAGMSRAEVDRLLDMARTADDGSRPQKPRKAKAPKVPRSPGGTRGGGTGEVLVEATRSGVLAWPELLDDGWTVTSDWQGRTGLRRPSYGEPTNAPDSANVVDGVLVVHSESVPWAVVGEGYNAPQALAASRFGGDYAAAMKAVEDGSTGPRPAFMAAWPQRVLDAVTASKAVDLAEWKRQKDREKAGAPAVTVTPSQADTAAKWDEGQDAAVEPEPWDDPVPLGGGTPAPVPLDALPGFLRRMVEAVAEQSQAPREVVLAAALGTLAAATRGVWDVHVRGGWNAGPSVLWITALAASGERKGAGTKPLTAPLIDAERHLAGEVRRANRNREVERRQLEAILKAADAEGDPTAYQRLAERIHEARPRPVPGLVISDATTEALGQYMTGQGGACAIFGTEASSFQTVAGRYSDAGGNFSLLNNAYDGEPYADLRIKRDGVRVERPALTWSVAVQPDVLAGYADSQSEGSGFLARFLLLVPASNIGRLNYRSEQVPEHVSAEWAGVVEGLHAEAWRRYEAMTESLPDDLGPPSSVTFTDDAAELVIEYGERLDREAADGGAVAHLGGWASKAPARIARLAAVLALAEDPHRRDVRTEHVAAALALADSFTAHAGAAFGILRQTARLDPAARLVSALRKIGATEVTTREVWQVLRDQTSWVNSTDDVRRALDSAEDLGYVRRRQVQGGGSGGRPSERWEVHPSLTR